MSKYKDLIAGSDEESEYGDEVSKDSEAEARHIEEMRKKLLGGISEEPDWKVRKDLQADSDAESLDVQFGVGFGEDIGQTLLEKKAQKKERAGMSDFQKWQEKKADRRREKKKEAK